MMISITINTLERRGYQLSLEDGKVTYKGPERLPEKTLESMRENKVELIAWIQAREKLSIVATGLGCPIDELLDFYQNDMVDIARLDMDALRFIIRDYIQYRNALI